MVAKWIKSVRAAKIEGKGMFWTARRMKDSGMAGASVKMARWGMKTLPLKKK